jgi:hypothetical protein
MTGINPRLAMTEQFAEAVFVIAGLIPAMADIWPDHDDQALAIRMEELAAFVGDDDFAVAVPRSLAEFFHERHRLEHPPR